MGTDGRTSWRNQPSKISSNSTIEITCWIGKENYTLKKMHVDLSMSMTPESLASLDRAIHPAYWPYRGISCNYLSKQLLNAASGSDNYAHCPYMRNMPQRLSAMHFGSNLVTSNRLYPKPKTYQQKWYTVIGDIYAAND
jgi:hypothetical protein